MWNELLPKLVGRQITDDDAPDEPAIITGYEVTDDWIEIKTAEWSWGGSRKYVSVSAGPVEGALRFSGVLMGATVAAGSR